MNLRSSKPFPPNQAKQIYILYFKKELSTVKIAEQFHCDPKRIGDSLRRDDFKLRSFSEAGKIFGSRKRKSDKRTDKYGYILIYKPKHPNADRDGWVREHRVIIEKHLNRFLTKNEIIHHKNGIVSDNRIENLMLFNESKKHLHWHKLERKQTALLKKDFKINY